MTGLQQRELIPLIDSRIKVQRRYDPLLQSKTLEDFRENVGIGRAGPDTEAFAAALAYGGEIRLGPKTYKLGGGGIATKRTALWGEHCSVLQLTSDFPDTENVVTLKPAFGEQFTGWSVRGFDIQCDVDGVALHAIEIDHTAHAYVSHAELIIERLRIGRPLLIDTHRSVSGYGIHYTPHPTDPDGLFCSIFRDLEMSSGIFVEGFGDSMNIERVKLYGSGRGMYIAGVGGAANLRVVGCNITTAGGAIHIKNCPLTRIQDSQVEMISAWDGDSDPDNRALLVFEDCPIALVENNNLNASLFTSDHAHCIALKGTTARVRVTDSNHFITTSPYKHIHSVSSQVPAAIVDKMWWAEQPPNTLVRNLITTHVAGTIVGIWSAPVTLVNSWVASSLAGALYEGLMYRVMPDGQVRLRGSISGGTNVDGVVVATLPVIARPLKIVRFDIRVYNGTDYVAAMAAIDTSGNIQFPDALVANTVVSFDGSSYDIM